MTLPSRFAVIIIILFHAVGIVGLSLPVTQPLFLEIVPAHLLLMLIVIIATHKGRDASFYSFMLIIFVSGIVLEWIGVHKQWLFGDYRYGQTLGWKILDIPLTIGINWFLLIYAAGTMMQYSRLKNMPIRVLAGATILVLLDLLIEPVAIRFDYWHWTEGVIPLKNYICWFLVSAGMLVVFEKFSIRAKPLPAVTLLVCNFVFFIILNLMK